MKRGRDTKTVLVERDRGGLQSNKGGGRLP